MKKLLVMLVLVLVAFSSMAVLASFGLDGPAPNSGDGVSDGSGFDPLRVPNGGTSGTGHCEPAPNSGDGESDGSGF